MRADASVRPPHISLAGARSKRYGGRYDATVISLSHQEEKKNGRLRTGTGREAPNGAMGSRRFRGRTGSLHV